MTHECAVLEQHQKTGRVLEHLTIFVASAYILMQQLTKHWPQAHTSWSRFRDNVLSVLTDEESIRELRAAVQEQLSNPDESSRDPSSLFSAVKKRLIHSTVNRLAL